MDKVILSAKNRSTDMSAKDILKAKMVPCVVYGNVENMNLQIDAVALKKAYIKAGESTLVEIDVDGKKVPVLFHALDFDPILDSFRHVDFYAVNMKKEVEADVHIRFEGEAPAVTEHNAVLVHALEYVTVKALPANLPHDLPLDLSKLVELDSSLHVSDLMAPEGVTILNDPEDTVVVAQAPREEEPEEAPAAEGEGTEGAEGEKKEGEEGAEGEKKDEQ